MPEEPFGSIEEHFGEISDPRQGQNVQHKLLDVIIIAICGVICGADGWVEIENFGRQKEGWLRKYLELPKGIPSHDTFGRVFARIDPEEFQHSFMEWVQAIQEITRGQVIGVDGKQLRRSHDMSTGKSALYMVNAWAEANHLVLGQRQVDEHSNEIKAIPELLKLLDIQGCIVTIDAIGTQKQIAKTILERGADYALAVKDNQAKLHQDIRYLFEYDQCNEFQEAPYDYAKTVNKGHGRIDVRECWTTDDPEYLTSIRALHKWPGLQSIAMVVTKRFTDEKISSETRFYISSLAGNAEQILHAVRGHWGVENGLHWVLDVAFDEDHSRVRKDHAPANLAVLRQMALNLLKQENTAKGGIKAKRLQAGWNEDYLLKVLSG
jgi:predicted transposase YbfD/YdcC